MQNRFVFLIFLIFFAGLINVGSLSYAFDYKIKSGFLVDTASLSLKDPADKIYIGEINNVLRLGVGGQAAILFPINDLLSVGPNFNFTFNELATNWYTLNTYLPSIGPMLEINFGKNSIYLFLNYNIGWISTEQEISSVSEGTAPAGSFSASVRGWSFGLRSSFPITDYLVIGPYLSYGVPSILEFKYKSLFLGQYSDKRVNIDTTLLQAGLTIYVDQFFPR
jgi:hypothetical protein